MLKLYQFGNSVCAQKVRITLSEKDQSWETREVNLFTSEQYDPEYLKLNPKGLVPTLVHDGKPIIESTVICEYVDETFPDPKLKPENPYERAQMRLWSKAVDEGLHEGVVEISFSAMFRERMKKMSDEQREIRFRNVGDPKRRDRFMSTYEQGVDSPYVYRGVMAYEKAFADMESALAGGNDWLMPSGYSLADINMMPYAARLAYLNLLDIWIDDKPLVQAWWRRAKAVPAFIKGIVDPLTDKEEEEMMTFGCKIKDQIRAVSDKYLSPAVNPTPG